MYNTTSNTAEDDKAMRLDELSFVRKCTPKNTTECLYTND